LARGRFRPTTTDTRHQLPIAPNLLQQKFSAWVPNRVWLADITSIPTGEGWLSLAAVLDRATRKVVGWAMRDPMRTELTRAALMMATQRPGPGLIHHTDRGSQDGFKRSSQHPEGGGCDEPSKASVGSIWTSAATVAGSATCGGTR
jgi:transposase InsO family protein